MLKNALPKIQCVILKNECVKKKRTRFFRVRDFENQCVITHKTHSRLNTAVGNFIFAQYHHKCAAFMFS